MKATFFYNSFQDRFEAECPCCDSHIDAGVKAEVCEEIQCQSCGAVVRVDNLAFEPHPDLGDIAPI